MEQGKITVEKSKKGKLIPKITFSNGKTMTVPPNFKISEDMNGKECMVEREKGQIVQIVVDGKALEINDKKINKKVITNKNTHYNSHNSEIISFATAPYNFVPLNEKIVSVDKPKDFNMYYGNTGYIDIEIETQTPVYIRGNNSDFYKQAEKYRIPGSSLRGMIKTLVEIVSWSEFGHFNDDYLYYRSFADKAHTIRDEYNKKMKDKNGNYKINAGFLIKKNLNYYIIPGKWEQIKKSDIKKTKEKSKIYNKENKFYACEYEENKTGNSQKYLIVSGPMHNKKREWLIWGNPYDDNNKIEIHKKDINSYLNDRNRKSVNLIEELKKSKFGFVPCFYIKWRDRDGVERISLGHTGLFRISYEKSIGEHISQFNKGEIDLAKSIFGIENKFMTRVFFEDATLEENCNDKIEKNEKIPKTLLKPKPTSFQLYLEQSAVRDIKHLKHYNNDISIRGNKLYWHKDKSYNPWKNDFSPKIDTKIKPINPGAKFKGRIRFENLTDEELGALLFVLDLPEGFCHKIGMGKPLGLGSIKTTPILFLSNRTERYQKLFSEWGDLNVQSKEEMNNFKKKFEEFILNELGENNEKSLWNTDRLKELAAMLDFENRPSINKTEYMELKEFKERKILPKPTVVINKNN